MFWDSSAVVPLLLPDVRSAALGVLPAPKPNSLSSVLIR